MGSLATFKSSYLATTVVPTGQREQLAGLVLQVDQQVASGATVTQAVANINNKRAIRVIHNAQALSSPTQGALASDFLALNAA